MLNSFLSLLLFVGCGSSDSQQQNHTPTKNHPVAEQADASHFVEGGTFASDGRGTTTNVAEGSAAILERHKKLGSVPQNTIALWLEAAIRAQNGEQAGWDALTELTLPLHEDPTWKSHSRNSYFVKAIVEQNPAFRSFIIGARPENAYAVDLNQIQIKVAYENKKDSRGRKFMIESSGSTMPRPIYLKQSTTTKLFYVTEYSSMYVDVQAVIDLDAETFE